MGSTRTTKILRETRKPSVQAQEARKLFDQRKKLIKDALAKDIHTVPAIAAECGLEPFIVTYVLMTLRKYGEVIETGLDDMNEYYEYQLIKEVKS
jgi:hypothetical protein